MNAHALRVSLFLVGAFLTTTIVGGFPSQTHSGAYLSKLDDFKIEKNKTTEKEPSGSFRIAREHNDAGRWLEDAFGRRGDNVVGKMEATPSGT